MSFGPVLYGSNLYSKVDYSTNPALLVATETVSFSDSTANSINSPIADSMSAPTDATANVLGSSISDTQPTTDSAAVLYSITLTDFLLCKEFIGSHLSRAQNWVMGSKSRTVTPHLYGQVLYAQNMYSTNIAILWKQAKQDATPTFTNADGYKYNS